MKHLPRALHGCQSYRVPVAPFSETNRNVIHLTVYSSNNENVGWSRVGEKYMDAFK